MKNIKLNYKISSLNVVVSLPKYSRISLKAKLKLKYHTWADLQN